MTDIDNLTRRALQDWGTEAQLNMVIEECSELINAIQKWRRHRVDSLQVLEEGVDVELMIDQLKVMLDAPTLWGNVRKEKMERLEKLLFQEDQGVLR